jgi:hypothetical protein
MEFYNHYRPIEKTMALYDQTEPLQQPIGFVHFPDRSVKDTDK